MEMQERKIKISGLDNEMSEQPWTFVAKGHFCAIVPDAGDFMAATVLPPWPREWSWSSSQTVGEASSLSPIDCPDNEGKMFCLSKSVLALWQWE